MASLLSMQKPVTLRRPAVHAFATLCLVVGFNARKWSIGEINILSMLMSLSYGSNERIKDHLIARVEGLVIFHQLACMPSGIQHHAA